MALAALGLQFCLVSVGAGSHLQNVPAELFSDVLHFPHISTFHFCQLPVIWQAAPFWLILLIGSEACLQESLHVARITKQILETNSAYKITRPVMSIFESRSCTVPEGRFSKHDHICTQALDFGYLGRSSRWCVSSSVMIQGSPASCARHVSVVQDGDGLSLKFSGKPCPRKVFLAGGFRLRDSVDHGSCDGIVVLEKGEMCRQAFSSEIAQMLCIPTSALQVVDTALGHSSCLEEVVDKSFHLPSFALALSFCFSRLPCNSCHIPRPWYEADESRLRVAVQHTVFDPNLCQSFPGLLDAGTLAQRMLHRCTVERVYLHTSHADLRAALAQVPLADLQVFWIHTQLHNMPGEVQGPDWSQQKEVSRSAIAAGVQRGSGLSKYALPPLCPAGLTKEEHVEASANLESPFDRSSPLDFDLDFCCQLFAVFGPFARTWRRAQLKSLQKLGKVLRPWEDLCVSCMPPSVRKVASRKKPMFMLACSLLLRWPDETNALRFITGFPIVGKIEHTGIFRPLNNTVHESCGTDVLLGASASANLHAMHHRVRPGSHDVELAEMTREEVACGFADGVFDESELNQMFGVGGWRALERFVHVQSCGKLRCIDSGKSPGHNRASLETETIFTTSVDVLPAIVRRTCDLVFRQRSQEGDALPPWCDFVLGTEDMKHAYRQCPIVPDQRCCSVIAFWDHVHHSIRFVVLNSLPFGLSSAVLNFNRTPALLTAVARRMTGCAASYFFDDSCVVDLVAGQGFAQACLREIYSLAGAELDPDKSQVPAGCRAFLGLSANLAMAACSGVVEFDLKPGFRESVQREIDGVFEAGVLTSGQAAKLRGKFGWAASGTYGRCGRGGQAPLVQRQYFDTVEDLTVPLQEALMFHSLLASSLLPRQVQIFGTALPPVRIYSDASFEPGTDTLAGIGFVAFDAAALHAPVGMAASLPPEVLALFNERHQQITPCEAILSIIVPHNLPQAMANRDVIWFIDNQAACQLLTKGCSTSSDLCFIASLAHLMFARLRCRVYFEYIESHANPSDGLSRAGLEDTWTLLQNWNLMTAEIPDLIAVAASSLTAALRLI